MRFMDGGTHCRLAQDALCATIVLPWSPATLPTSPSQQLRSPFRLRAMVGVKAKYIGSERGMEMEHEVEISTMHGLLTTSRTVAR